MWHVAIDTRQDCETLIEDHKAGNHVVLMIGSTESPYRDTNGGLALSYSKCYYLFQ